MLWAFLLPGFLSGAQPETASGIVVDPQQRRIVGATVDLRCGSERVALTTDREGRFTLPEGAARPGCVVTIEHPGFAAHTEPTDSHPPAWIISLHLAPMRDALHVTARGANAADRFSLASAALSASDIRRLSDSFGDLQMYVASVAGTTIRRTAVIVDGLPSDTQPPPDEIDHVSFNIDPFSVEYGEVDRNVLEVTTAPPDRTFRFNVGAAPPTAGGANPLGRGLATSSYGFNGTVSGGVPRLPIALTLSADVNRLRTEQPICAQLAAETGPRCGSSIDTTRDAAQWQTGLRYAGRSTRATVTVAGSIGRLDNSGVGGLVRPEAGVSGRQTMREVRFAAERSWAGVRLRGGLVSGAASTETSALSADIGVTVMGMFTDGGAATAAARTTRRHWTAKTVVESTDRSGSVGVIVRRQTHAIVERPNPFGTLLFPNAAAFTAARQGESSGMWLLTRGLIDQQIHTLTAATFAERVLVRRADITLRAGLRSEFERGDGVFLGSRLFGQWHANGWTLRGGAGAFSEAWPPDILLLASRSASEHGRQFVIPYASMFTASDPLPPAAARLETAIDPAFVRRRDVRMMTGAERRIGPVVVAVEHTYTVGSHLAGSRRLPAPGGWTDVLDSDRTLRRQQLHTVLEPGVAGQNISLHYEWVHSLDDTDGPLSFAERSNDIGAEWAPTTGASPHNAMLVAPLQIPKAISLTLLATWRSSAPLTILSGTDPEANGLFNGRDGLPRNSGRGRAYRSVTILASRTVRLPDFLTTAGIRAFDIGVNVDNVFNAQNYLAVGTVRGSPSFMQPLSALPGRSVRVWLKFRDL